MKCDACESKRLVRIDFEDIGSLPIGTVAAVNPAGCYTDAQLQSLHMGDAVAGSVYLCFDCGAAGWDQGL